MAKAAILDSNFHLFRVEVARIISKGFQFLPGAVSGPAADVSQCRLLLANIQVLEPDAGFPRSEDTVGIQRLLENLVDIALHWAIRLGDLVHESSIDPVGSISLR